MLRLRFADAGDRSLLTVELVTDGEGKPTRSLLFIAAAGSTDKALAMTSAIARRRKAENDTIASP
jgi:hypothetical protein